MTNPQGVNAGTANVRTGGWAIVAAGVALVAYTLTWDLIPIGRDLLVLGVVRLVLAGGLWDFAKATGIMKTPLGPRAVYAVVVLAAVNLAGAVLAVLADGIYLAPFEPGAPEVNLIPYAIVGLSAVLFSVATIVLGVLAWKRGLRLSGGLLVAAGVLYFPAVAVASVGHLVWISLWIAFGLVIALGGRDPRSNRAVDRPSP